MAPDVGPRNVPGRRNRNPRPTQPAKLPASVVRIAVVGEDPAERRDRSGPGGRPGRPTACRRRPRPPPRRRGPSRLSAWRVATTCRVEHGPAQEPFVGGLEERLGVGGDRQGRRGRAGRAARRRGRRGPTAGPGAASCSRTSSARSAASRCTSERIGGVEPLPDRRRGTEAGHPEVERMVVRDDVARVARRR